MQVTPELILQVLIIGIANGAILALIALGYTMVYGIIELINFAHGEVFMLGTMLSLTLVTWVPSLMGLRGAWLMPTPLLIGLLLATLALSMLFCGLLNVGIERFAYRRLRNAPRLAALITAIGVSFILINVGLHWKGVAQLNFPNLLPNVNLLTDVLGLQTSVVFSAKDLLVIGLTIPLMLGLQQFIRRTRLGKAMRATAQDREAAQMMGIDVNLTIALTFLLGGALAGAAGLVFGLYNNYAWFLQGFRNGLYAFTAAVMGGIGNITGAAVGGFLIGLLAAFSDFFFDPRWTQAVVFAVLILILVLRPTGILGEKVAERA